MTPTTTRTKLNTAWRFQPGDVVDASRPDYDDSGWTELDLPHDWSIDGPFAEAHYIPERKVANHLEGRADSYLPKGVGWYRRSLRLPAADARGRVVYLEFEGVFRNSTLWVNGHEAGHHPYGYTGFVVDITRLLRQGDGAGDVLSLRVDATETEGWWYEGSGIYRHVWLIVKDLVHVRPWGTCVTTPAAATASATVRVRTELENRGSAQAPCTIVTDILGPDGCTVATVESAAAVDPDEPATVEQQCELRHPLLWSPVAPHLYTARTAVGCGDRIVDTVETRFGVRGFQFTSDRGFLLNGTPLQWRGGCLHHDFGGLGCALPDRANEKTVEVLKAMGCTAVRSAHNPASPALMDACDRLGLLFWAETRTLGPPDHAAPALRELIRRDRNHPCIMVWSLANTAGSPDGALSEHLRALNDVAHAEDPTRPSAVALEGNADANANGFALVTDVVGYNGGGMHIDDRDHRLYPDRKMLITEFSSGRGARGVYDPEPEQGTEWEEFGDGRRLRRHGRYATIYDLCLTHEREWRHIAARPWLAGGLMWSVIEYRGETSGWPVVTSQFGPLDICRFPKDTYYFYQQEWTDRPMLHVFPHWTWPGREGRSVEVWSYTTCDTVDLFANSDPVPGIPHFLQHGAGRPHLCWRVPYQPGLLVAEGRIAGRVVCRRELRTAGAPAAVTLVPDRTVIRADGEDLSFVTVRIDDDAGTPVPAADNPVQVRVEGPGRLLGLCSGDPKSHEPPKTDCVKVFNGLCLAIVQSTGERGAIRVTVSSPGLRPGAADLEVG